MLRGMTALLQKAFAEAAKLPQSDQDRLAAWLLDEMHDEARWDAAFAASQNALDQLADRALAEIEAGLDEAFDPDSLENPTEPDLGRRRR